MQVLVTNVTAQDSQGSGLRGMCTIKHRIFDGGVPQIPTTARPLDLLHESSEQRMFN